MPCLRDFVDSTRSESKSIMVEDMQKDCLNSGFDSFECPRVGEF